MLTAPSHRIYKRHNNYQIFMTVLHRKTCMCVYVGMNNIQMQLDTNHDNDIISYMSNDERIMQDDLYMILMTVNT